MNLFFPLINLVSIAADWFDWSIHQLRIDQYERNSQILQHRSSIFFAFCLSFILLPCRMNSLHTEFITLFCVIFTRFFLHDSSDTFDHSCSWHASAKHMSKTRIYTQHNPPTLKWVFFCFTFDSKTDNILMIIRFICYFSKNSLILPINTCQFNWKMVAQSAWDNFDTWIDWYRHFR